MNNCCPLFTVIVPVYNPGPFLCSCIDSILSQTYRGFELICVDNGSTDGSSTVLDKYAEKHSNLLVLHQENKGVSVARNTGIACAKGEWLYFVDSDDMVDINCLSNIKTVIDKHPDIDILAFQTRQINEVGDVIADNRSQHSDSIDIHGDIIEQITLCKERADLAWCVWDKVFNRSVVSNYCMNFCEGMTTGEDCLFVNQYLSHSRHYIYDASFVGYYYRRHGQQTMKHVSVAMLLNDIKQFEEYLKAFLSDNRCGPQALIKLYAKRVMFSCRKTQARKEYLDLLYKHDAFKGKLLPYAVKHLGFPLSMLSVILLIMPKAVSKRMLQLI